MTIVNEFDSGFDNSFDPTPDATPGLGWISIDEARDWWRDAPHDDEYLQMLLDVAGQQVLAYGPYAVRIAIEEGLAVPNHYRVAQLAQTRNIWNASKLDPSGTIGGDPGFSFTPFPLDWTIKQIIRPKTAKPVLR